MSFIGRNRFKYSKYWKKKRKGKTENNGKLKTKRFSFNYEVGFPLFLSWLFQKKNHSKNVLQPPRNNPFSAHCNLLSSHNNLISSIDHKHY